METVGGAAATAAACAFGALTLTGFFSMRELCRRQRESHPDAWRADGCPALLLPWEPPPPGAIESEEMSGVVRWLVNSNRVMFRWMFRMPAWIGGDPPGLALLWALRVSQIAAMLVFVAWCVWL